MMKRLSHILLSTAVLLGGTLAGCYEDKGNYDYHDINEMTVTLLAKNQDGRVMPIGDGGMCRYKQPSSTDTLRVTYTPEVKQSMATDEANLEYNWKVSYTKDNKPMIDTITTKELTLVFPPQQTTFYNVLFKITDISTNLSFYQTLSINTVKPYINSWLVLNGEKGDRRISAVEEPDSSTYIFTADAYMDLGNGRRFQEAIDLIYSPSYLEGSEIEALLIMEADSLSLMSPFDMKVVKKTAQLLPSVILDNSRQLLYGLDGNVQNPGTVIVDDSRKIYYADRTKQEYQEFRSTDVPNYQVDKIGEANESSYICFWDKNQKQFMYADCGKGSVETFADDTDWENKEVIWMGADNKHDKEAMGIALVKETKTENYWLYHFHVSGGFSITKENIGKLPIDETSQFAVCPMEFEGQLFYTVGSVLYRFFADGKESFELYDAGAPITQLQFRTSQEHGLTEHWDYFRCLGIVVDKGKEGELHEVKLDNSGDVISSNVFTGFGPIQDICFTFVNRVVL